MPELLPRGARPAGLRRLLGCAIVLGIGSVPRVATAQVHWDASAQVGVMKRFLAHRPPGGDDPGFGPTAQVAAHVALLPLVHVGGYAGADVSPLPGDAAARNIFFGGLRVKGMLPWLRRSSRAWIFGGFGYAAAYAPSYTSIFEIEAAAGSSVARKVRVEGGGGTFFEVPFGIGASYKVFSPWELCAELGVRAAFGSGGTIYDPPGPGVVVENFASQRAAPVGLDRWGLGLTLGARIDL